MDLVVVLGLVYIGGPIGLLLVFIAALSLRRDRPKRGWTVLACFVPLALAIVWIWTNGLGTMRLYLDVPDWARTVTSTIEVLAVGSLPLIVVATIVLLSPVPENRRAFGFGVTGLVCLAVAGLAGYALAQTNFSY